ncbi:hypothetical protein DAPPUDRAFT_262598 [Daphnia pulex]|uniref:BTB domain-containing protein n=1 Tax=Daphnia pulex TaxID=6669 RepID=E9HN95_DAPPU|nr:hypothetical protein DAPPUDRAFT_262598 [Daphnia pulex]|eukprot:EFX66797.1 hypothetical protein DAPPUDRAFT_262598 [Daphnia pulex]
MSQEHSEAETVLNSIYSDLSYSSLPSLKIETETPTVTELSIGFQYFQALLRSNYRESLTGEVSVVDIPYQLFVDVVGFLYTDMIPTSYCTTSGFESLCLMCEIANHYSSENLLTYCERLIIARLDLCNAMSL